MSNLAFTLTTRERDALLSLIGEFSGAAAQLFPSFGARTWETLRDKGLILAPGCADAELTHAGRLVCLLWLALPRRVREHGQSAENTLTSGSRHVNGHSERVGT